MKTTDERRTAGNSHGTFCPRRVSWTAPCTCRADHQRECPAIAFGIDRGVCDCGVDAPRDEVKYGGVLQDSKPSPTVTCGRCLMPINDPDEAVIAGLGAIDHPWVHRECTNLGEDLPRVESEELKDSVIGYAYFPGKAKATAPEWHSVSDHRVRPEHLERTWVFEYIDRDGKRRRGGVQATDQRHANNRIAAVYGEVMDWEEGVHDLQEAKWPEDSEALRSDDDPAGDVIIPESFSEPLTWPILWNHNPMSGLISQAWLDKMDAEILQGATPPIICGSWTPAVETAIDQIKARASLRRRQEADAILYGDPEADEPEGVINGRSPVESAADEIRDDRTDLEWCVEELGTRPSESGNSTSANVRRARAQERCGFDDGEAAVHDSLMEAYGRFLKIKRQHPDEAREFVYSIHRLQDLLGMRVVRRLRPKGWPTHEAFSISVWTWTDMPTPMWVHQVDKGIAQMMPTRSPSRHGGDGDLEPSTKVCVIIDGVERYF